MIVPTDNLLNKAVEFYDPVKKTILLTKEFWQRFFPMFLRDFVNETNTTLTPDKKVKIAKSVKSALYEYWYRRFVENKDHGSLYTSLQHVFNLHRSPRSYVSSSFYEVNPPDNVVPPLPEDLVVDALVSDYAAMETQSVRELELEAVFQRASKSYYAEEHLLSTIKDDYTAGLLDQFMVSECTLSTRVRFVDECSKWYVDRGLSVGFVTLWNLLLVDTKEIGYYAREFPVARFESFHKQYSPVLSYRRLVDKIGYDVACMLYKKVVSTGKFIYTTVYEYMLCTLMLCDMFKRDVVYSQKVTIEPFIVPKIKPNNGLCFSGTLDVPSKELKSVNHDRSIFSNVSFYSNKRNSRDIFPDSGTSKRTLDSSNPFA